MICMYRRTLNAIKAAGYVIAFGEVIGDFMFERHSDETRIEIMQLHCEDLELIDYDPDDRYPAHCVQGGVVNLDAFDEMGRHKSPKRVLRYLWNIDEFQMDHSPFVLELDMDGVQRYHIYNLTGSCDDCYTGEK